MSNQTHPSRTIKGFCDKAPAWRLYCGSFHVLHYGDDVGGSASCGSIGEYRPLRGRAADITIPGTKECQGAFGLRLGYFFDLAEAKAAVESAVAERHRDPLSYDAAARIANRQRLTIDEARAALAKKAA